MRGPWIGCSPLAPPLNRAPAPAAPVEPAAPAVPVAPVAPAAPAAPAVGPSVPTADERADGALERVVRQLARARSM